MKILIISGEISSDRYAAHLAKALKESNPQATLFGVGGKQTAKVVDTFLHDIADDNVIGILEVFRKNRSFKKFMLQLESFLVSTPIDRVVMLDFPHRNFQLATLFHSFHLPIYTFITPNFWIWKNKKQAQKLVGYSKCVVAIFEREYNFYRQFGRHIHYFGHPLAECVTSTAPSPIKKPAVIGLLPGSRRQEIGYHLPAMLETVKKAQTKCQDPFTILIKVSSPAFKPIVEKIVSKSGLSVRYEEGSLELFLSKLSVMITVAGTVTLEGVIRNVPQLIVGRVSTLTYLIARYILHIKLPLIGLPNIILGKKAIPEFVQTDMIPEHMANALLPLLTEEARRTTFDRYAQVRSMLTRGESVFKQVAALVLK